MGNGAKGLLGRVNNKCKGPGAGKDPGRWRHGENTVRQHTRAGRGLSRQSAAAVRFGARKGSKGTLGYRRLAPRSPGKAAGGLSGGGSGLELRGAEEGRVAQLGGELVRAVRLGGVDDGLWPPPAPGRRQRIC